MGAFTTRLYSVISLLLPSLQSPLCPCFAAIGAIHREMGEAKWTWIAIGFQTGLAYASSLVIYQIGLVLIHGQLPTVWTFIAIFLIITAIYSLVKKPTNTLPIVTLKTLEKENINAHTYPLSHHRHLIFSCDSQSHQRKRILRRLFLRLYY